MPNKWDDPIEGVIDMDTEMREPNDPVLKQFLLPLLIPVSQQTEQQRQEEEELHQLQMLQQKQQLQQQRQQQTTSKSNRKNKVSLLKLDKDNLPDGWKAKVTDRGKGKGKIMK